MLFLKKNIRTSMLNQPIILIAFLNFNLRTNIKKYIIKLYACLAQLVEHPSHTRIVTSSSLVVGIFLPN